jgi:hypothetical protein
MKDISKENLIQILKNWRDVCNHQKDLERHLLKLARHPDSTMGQLELARDVYRKSYASLQEMKQTVTAIGMKYHREQYVAKVTLTEV